MEALKWINLAVRFLLELCVLVAVGYWGFRTGQGWVVKTGLGIGAPVLIAVLWGAFGAPKSSMQLHGLSFLALEVIVFGSGVAALVASGQSRLAAAFGVIVVVNRILLYFWRQ